MALLHRATLVPSKSDLVGAWLPGRPWAPPGPIGSGVTYRLDDPDGEVGMEGFLLTDTTGHTVHLALTYRAQPLDGAEEHLLGTTQHSVLGTRWVYDGCGDPVWVATVASTIATGAGQADELVDVDGAGTLQRRDPTVQVSGSGQPGTVLPPVGAMRLGEGQAVTTITCDFGEVVVVHRVGADPDATSTLTATLTATWDSRTAVLGGLRLR